MLRDLVHASISFKELARQTGFDEKALHRTLSIRGNPTARTLEKIVSAIRDDLGFVPSVNVAVASRGSANIVRRSLPQRKVYVWGSCGCQLIRSRRNTRSSSSSRSTARM